MTPLALLSLLLADPAVAAEPTHALQASTGLTWLSRTDRMLSPRNLHGAMPRFGLAYEARSDRWTTQVDLSATLGRYRSHEAWEYTWDGETPTSEASAATLGALQIAVGRRIGDGPWDLRVGATSANQAANYVFVATMLGAEHYFGAFELGPWIELRRDLGKRHHLTAEAWVPAVSWVARNPYAMHDAEHIWNTRSNSVPLIVGEYIADGQLTTWDRYQAVHTRAGWTFDLGEHWALDARARLDWLHHTTPHPLVELQLGADLALQGRF